MSNWQKILLVTVISLLLAGLFTIRYVFGQINEFVQQPLQTDGPTLVTVKPGQSIYKLLNQWQDRGWIQGRKWLRATLWLKPYLGAIRAGTYQIHSSMGLEDALVHLATAPEHQFQITFVEGSTWRDWVVQMEQAPHLDFALSGLEQKAILQRLDIDYVRIEGLLYPDTYFYTSGTSAYEIVERAYRKMVSQLKNTWINRDSALSPNLKNPYDALILASIIEKETGAESERARISAVFHNRLKKKMRLQTDPTVIYGMGERYQGNIRKSDLRESTPYNTYVIKGLPPTPIAMPGIAAIEAAVQPDLVDDLYFVARGDGSHVFSKSLAEHNANVRKFILNKE